MLSALKFPVSLVPRLLFLLFLAAGFVAVAGRVAAESPAASYPVKPVKLIVPFAPGGFASDLVARIVAAPLGERLGQAVVVENRPGAAGNIGFAIGAHAPADGYTLTLITSNITTNPHLYSNLRFDPIKDFEPVVLLTKYSHILLVHPSVPARNVAELIALAKAKPGAVTAGHGGVGGSGHISAALLASMAGVSLTEVPYKSASQVIPDLMSGRVMLTFNALTGTKPLISAGKLRGLAVTSAQRSPLFPDVPTVAENVPGYESDGWYGVAAPAGVPAAIVKKLADEALAVLNLAEPRQKLLEQGLQISGATGAQFAQIIRADTEKYGKLMRDFGIKPQE